MGKAFAAWIPERGADHSLPSCSLTSLSAERCCCAARPARQRCGQCMGHAKPLRQMRRRKRKRRQAIGTAECMIEILALYPAQESIYSCYC